MSQEEVQELVESQLSAASIDECKLISVDPDDQGAFDVTLHLTPSFGKRPGSIATQANALAVQVLKALENDCGMKSYAMQPFSGTVEKPLLSMTAKFSFPSSASPLE